MKQVSKNEMEKREKERGGKNPRILHIPLCLFEMLRTFDDTRSKWVARNKNASSCFLFSDRVLVNITVNNYSKPGTARPGYSVPQFHEFY